CVQYGRVPPRGRSRGTWRGSSLLVGTCPRGRSCALGPLPDLGRTLPRAPVTALPHAAGRGRAAALRGGPGQGRGILLRPCKEVSHAVRPSHPARSLSRHPRAAGAGPRLAEGGGGLGS